MNLAKHLLPALNEHLFSDELIAYIHENQWFNLWVPQSFNGLGSSFPNGLKILHDLAYCDGSLGWTVTLCSGANYFVGNLLPEIGEELFKPGKTCFGGSGMFGGTAEKIGNDYLINGTWHYATGGPYLSHFTLNALLTENGETLLDEEGHEKFLSFVLPKEAVSLIPSWGTMGLKATATHSFSVDNFCISKTYSFEYNKFHLNDLIFKIPFRVFADLTLLVNYLGIAKHFFDASTQYLINSHVMVAQSFAQQSLTKTIEFAEKVEYILANQLQIDTILTDEIHHFGEDVVIQLNEYVMNLYPLLGIKAASENHILNQIFRDYFTATQHRNFRKSGDN